VTLYAGHVASADETAILAGTNRIAVEMDGGEWEIIGFANATLTAPSTYTLSRLLRGQGGTTHAMGPASAGNRVVVLDGTPSFEPAAADWLGETITLHAYAGRNDPTGAEFSVDVGLPPELPLAPVHLSANRDGATGDVTLGWCRCSRADSDSWNVAEAPLEYLPELYQVVVFNGSTAVRTLSASSPTALYAAAQQTADFGSPPSSFTFTVAQVSSSFGPGLTATGAFHA